MSNHLAKDTELSKIKIIALHGGGSNQRVTNLQMNNLGLFDKNYEVICINAPIIASEAGTGIAELGGVIDGPWFSWLSKYDEKIEEKQLLDEICDAVFIVVKAIEQHGQFDCIYGFSQGAIIASLISGLHNDETLQVALLERYGDKVTKSLIENISFNNAIIACGVTPIPLDSLRLHAGLGSSPVGVCNSIHLIGKKDKFKPLSEALALSSIFKETTVIYIDNGHGIDRNESRNLQLIDLIEQHINEDTSIQLKNPEWKKSSQLSARRMDESLQFIEVNINNQTSHNTILKILSEQNINAPLFRVAREQDKNIFTTYGEMVRFFQPNGQGDLRRIGVKSGEVVAYLAPPGGNAIAATAFLSIAAQTCAVPLSSSMSEADTLLALEQFNVKHVIYFEGVSAKGAKAAISSFAKQEKLKIHQTNIIGNNSPGLFKFTHSIDSFDQLPTLHTLLEDYCLLLRTSGTTSTPKVVPLRQKDLIENAKILASNIGIESSDVTYSIMPLDHIGGLSASVLSSITVGASITCDGVYNPLDMVLALTQSNPKPTWYSAVPTIHRSTTQYLQDNAKQYLDENGRFLEHNLRFIRSGAAALKEKDRTSIVNLFKCDVLTTYSMSELMPICQPPQEQNSWFQKIGGVGVPVAASMAIVDPVTLTPLPYGTAGEVAVKGSTLFTGYMDNPEANNSSRFLIKSPITNQLETWFLTGDLGDTDTSGTLFLRGRIKELIKRGGEQIAPAEVENILILHPSVKTAVCFSVPSDVYGEEVGAAIVLNEAQPTQITSDNIMKEMRGILRENGVSPYKYPSAWRIVKDEELPRTTTRKFKRNGLAEALGITISQLVNNSEINEEKVSNIEETKKLDRNINCDLPSPDNTALNNKPQVDWASLAGFRFVLACYVMFMHIGSNESWDAFSNLRQFPWHVHVFFALAGYSLTIIMPPIINKKFSFIKARIWGMYPLYALAILFALFNILPVCTPSTFSSSFEWIPTLSNNGSMTCQGTPLIEGSWFANVFFTLAIHLTGLQATPLWGASWFLGFYLWFISMYFQCLIIFPIIYNALYKNRGKTKRLLLLTALALLINFIIILGFWYGFAVDATGYGFYDSLTGVKVIPTLEQLGIGAKDNIIILGFYLFAPFWMVYFVAGMCAAFLYDAVRPSEQKLASIWGYVADFITLVMIMVSVGHIAQGYFPYGVDNVSLDAFFMRPDEANSYADPGTVNRIWDNIWGRIFAPMTLLWIFALSTGKGLTAKVLRSSPLSIVLAPTAYACFLFHQIIGQWYYAITRHGEWWNWWTDQKSYYWFSPQPVNVNWYEYFYIVGLVVLFAKLMQSFEPSIRRTLVSFGKIFFVFNRKTEQALEEKDTTSEVLAIVERATGMEVEPEWSLEEAGLASLGVVQFTSSLEAEFSNSSYQIRLSITDVLAADDINEIIKVVDKAISDAQASSLGTKNIQAT